jgi:aldehyde dehydrogenase (NAD+)
MQMSDQEIYSFKIICNVPHIFCSFFQQSSEKTPLTAIHFAKLVKEAGFPAGVFNLLNGFGTAGEALVLHPKVAKIAFTGSTPVGKRIQELSSKNGLKRVSLELGGKSPMIVLDDADVDQAVELAHLGLFLNQGQCCVAGSRLFVQEAVYDKFVAAAVAKAKGVKIGPYDEPGAEQGPQVDKIQFDKVLGYIESGKSEGAKCMTGGQRHGTKGYFIEPTVFTDVSDDMKIATEEIFGPVMSIMKFKTDVEVIERANNTLYGLAAGICSKNAGRALGMANQLRAGTVWINCYDVFDSAAPFGGYGESGIGRDKGEDGLEAWTETKCVMIPLDGPKC